MDCFLLPIHDPLLLQAGCLIETVDTLIGVETGTKNPDTGFPKETAIMEGEVFMYLDVQPSRRSRSHFRFKIMCSQFIFIEATLKEFQEWFKIVYIPDW